METNIKQIAMGCKPNPFDYHVKKTEIVNGNTIVLANYHGCQSFNGDKLMLLRGMLPRDFYTNTATHSVSTDPLDPHFLNEDYPVVARFIPNEDGWKMARLCANNL
jgi:hypothetical protein